MLTCRAWLPIAMMILLAGGIDLCAQGSTAEGAIGYAFLSDDTTGIELPFGWVASIAGDATEWLALGGEVGGSYKKYSDGTADLTLKLHTFAAGPRFMVPSTAPFAPYAQLLFGIAHGSADLGVPGASVVVRGTSFLTQAAAGIDFNASRKRAFRLEVASRRLADDEDIRKQWRLIAAFVFRD